MLHLVLKINDADQIFEEWIFIFCRHFDFPVLNIQTSSAGKVKQEISEPIKQFIALHLWGFLSLTFCNPLQFKQNSL